MKKTVLISVAVIFMFCALVGALEAGDIMGINANSLVYESREKTYYLTGSVTLTKDDAVLTADYVEYNEGTSWAHAKGSVRYNDVSVSIEAVEAYLNLAEHTGTLTDARIFFKQEGFHVWGTSLTKVSENEYIADKASFTTCDAPVPAWCFYADEVSILLNDRIKASGVVGRIKDIPAFYSPVFYAPLTRRSGFLTPAFGFKGDKGFYANVPLYIVLSQNRDLTLNVDTYGKKGVGEGVEYRYVEKGGIEGNWWAYHFRDNPADKDYILIRGKHTHVADNGFLAKFNVNYLNEKDFFKEYSPEIEKTVERFLESTAEFSFGSPVMRAYAVSQYYTDLQFETDHVSQKMPELGFTVHPAGITDDLKVSFNSRAANFISEDGVKGSRLYFSPELYHTLGDALRFTQIGGTKLSYYTLSNLEDRDNQGSFKSLFYTGGLSMSLYKKYDTFTHIMEPFVGYSYLSDDLKDIPVFDVLERSQKISELSASVLNYFKDADGTFLYLKVTNPYSLTEENKDFGRSPLRVQLRLERPITLKAETRYDYNKKTVKTVNSELVFKLSDIDFLLGERYNKNDNVLFLTGGLGVNLHRDVRVNAITWYDARGEGLRNLSLDVIYASQCWVLDLLYRKTNDSYGVYFLIELKGLGRYRFFGI